MKGYFCLIVLVAVACTSVSQTNFNKAWIFGGYGIKIRFDNTPPDTYAYIKNGVYLSGGNSSICDSNGRVILVSDGMNIYDSTLNFIEKGDTLNSLDFYIHDNGINTYSQSSIFLSFENNIYYLITLDASDSMFNWWYAPDPNKNAGPFDRLLYHKIDMNVNGGAGKVIERQKIMIGQDSLLKSMMTACKHANGKDWWLVKQMYEYGGYQVSKNKIATFLITNDSIHSPVISYFPAPLFSSYDQNGQAMFSQDGTKYAATCRGTGKIFLADFDRCTGVFTNPKSYNVPEYNRHNPVDTTLMDPQTQGLTFSPNGDFLYVMKYWNILQLNLNDNDSNTAWYQVAGLDTTWQEFQIYNTSYLGYDNKLYIGYFAGFSKEMSVISNPDSKGINCNFCPKCLIFPSGWGWVTTPPNMPNYDLGAEPCWPLANENIMKNDEELEVYPNPASTTISIRSEQLRGKKVLVSMYNIVGQEVLSNECYFLSAQSTFNIKSLQSGVYLLKVGEWVRKVVVE